MRSLNEGGSYFFEPAVRVAPIRVNTVYGNSLQYKVFHICFNCNAHKQGDCHFGQARYNNPAAISSNCVCKHVGHSISISEHSMHTAQTSGQRV